jgi:small GTP-binding protein
LVSDTFSDVFVSTVGIDFHRSVQKAVCLQIWDAAGMETFRSITKVYYRGAHGMMFVFSLSDRSSFEKIELWRKDVEAENSSLLYMALVGNQADRESDRKVSETEAREYAMKHDMKYIETSARTGSGIQELFDGMADAIRRTIQ